ncbi:DUF4214 domain-containing protein [Tianweitania sediminis]|uniref:DUF4214 domain-containing protein n=1 Tax=Tianweitania sediminis TaxID=1502156 RepID=A0A8J7QYU5_9HYPH|nr:DUF4214 domain-containing protein [Tianweitania sediminis]MBP0437293.1 DUF4214 domain-containing protein [Tianweitania sediminis]
MAIFRAYTATDLISPTAWRGTVVTADSGEFTLTDGGREAVYLGTGLRYAPDLYLVDGIVTAYEEYGRDGNLLGEAYDFRVPAFAVADAIYANDLRGLLVTAFNGNDTVYGSQFSDRLSGFGGNDIINAGLGRNDIDGGTGFDYAVYSGRGADFTIDVDDGVIYLTRRDGAINDALFSVERLSFDNGLLAFDEGAAAGYRLYQAAFDRTPDLGGLSYWVDRLDGGTSLTSAAADFIGSAEFRSLYGSSPTDAQFVDLLYRNVLDRPADGGGYDYWLDRMDSGMSRAEVLVAFSQSEENRVNVQGAIENGIWLDAAYLA